MLEIRKTFIFIFSLNLIIVTVPREIGNFRQKFAEIQPAEIIDSLKQSLESIKEKSVNNDDNDDFVPTAKSPIGLYVFNQRLLFSIEKKIVNGKKFFDTIFGLKF